MSPDEITAAWLSSVLGGEVDSVTSRPVGDGHVSTSLRLRLESSDPAVPASLIAKLPAQDERSLLLAAAVRSYEFEVRFYRELAHTVDIRVPECRYSDWTPETNAYVLLLEDMAPAVQGDQVVGCSLDQAKIAVRALAALHGPRWSDPTLGELEWLPGNDPDASSDSWAMMWQMFFPGFAETYRRYLTPETMELAERFGPEIVRFFDGRAEPFSLVHTDYRLDNMLFGTADGDDVVTVVDWGSPRHGLPLIDLSYFLGAGLVPEDRRAHERELVDLYAESLAAYSVDVDAAWLWEQYRREAFHGLTITVLTSQMVTMNPRSLDMFGAMASRHLQHALDLDSISLI